MNIEQIRINHPQDGFVAINDYGPSRCYDLMINTSRGVAIIGLGELELLNLKNAIEDMLPNYVIGRVM